MAYTPSVYARRIINIGEGERGKEEKRERAKGEKERGERTTNAHVITYKYTIYLIRGRRRGRPRRPKK